MGNLILASSSPRRQTLIRKLVDEFTVVKPVCEEIEGGEPQYVAEANAVLKGRAVSGDFVVACDTLVELDGIIYGKPYNESRAAEMLTSLRGKTHTVISGVYVRFNGEETVFNDKSYVTFKPLSPQAIMDYVHTYQPLDKAGAYGLQDGVIVEKFTGSYDNIVGLPTEKLREVLRKYIHVKEESNN